ncbi:MAG: Ig-like domain-containing protein [Bacteroidales bacterium]
MKRKTITSGFTGYLLSGILLFCSTSLISGQPYIAKPDGYAGHAGTTGGGNATPVTVSTAADFLTAVNNSTASVIIVNGRLNVGNVTIGSNKTIIGANANSGLYGGTIKVNGSNYIFQNLTFGPASGDVMELSGATKVYITKCTMHDAGDEVLSIVRASDFVTVSWCKFYFDNTHSHAFGHLIGNSDDRITDRGKLHVTMHHNWYDYGIRGRQPRVRFGYVHIYNNYYNSVGSGYAIGIGYECHIRLENTHFDRVSSPWADYGGVSNGIMGWSNLIFEGCSQPTFMPNKYPAFSLPYSYSLTPVDYVKTIVKAGAGNVFGFYEENFPVVSVTSPADSAQYPSDSTVTIDVDATIAAGEIVKVSVYNDSLIAVDTIAPYSIAWGNVEDGIYKINAIALDSNGILGFSENITVFVGGGAKITAPANGQKITVPGNVTLSAFAWDGGGTIKEVEFFQGQTSLGKDTTGLFSYIWQNVQPGVHTIHASAKDNDENTFLSQEVTFTVTGGPAGYVFCCADGDTCKFSSASDVAYGANGYFRYKYNITDSIACNKQVFGDPVSGLAKGCYVRDAVITVIKEMITEPVKIYPNPVSSFLNVEFNGDHTGKVNISLFDITGKSVISINTEDLINKLDMTGLADGLYMLKINGNSYNRVELIVK